MLQCGRGPRLEGANVLINNRVIFENNTTLDDLSIALNNIFSTSETVDIVAAQDYLYLGSDLPFNHRYFNVSSANAIAASITVHVWNGTEWVAAVDVLDQTASTDGKCFAQSGILSWTLDKNKSWAQDDTDDMTGSGLETLTIYNMYWARLTFSANLTNTTALKYVGHKFATDSDLGGYYPDLNRTNVKTAYQSGKTDWTEQHVLAAEEIVRDLRKKQVLVNANQVFNWEIFTDAAVHKLAEIVYTAFGKDYEERRIAARDSYDEALDKVFFPVDKNKDGRLSAQEKSSWHGVLRRG